MKTKQTLIDRIDTIRVNTVDDEFFMAIWGHTLNEQMTRVMAYVNEQDVKIKKEYDSIKKHDKK